MSEQVLDEPLVEDLACAQCGYNLRTKRRSERCPECGHAVGDSVAKHRDRAMCDPRRAAKGAAMLAAASLGMLAWAVLQIAGLHMYINLNWYIKYGFIPSRMIVLFIVLSAAVGVELLLSGSARVVSGTPVVRARPFRLVRLVRMAVVAWAALGLVFAEGTVWMSAIRWVPLAITACAGAAVLYGMGGVWLFRLAIRRRWPVIAVATAVLFPLVVATMLAVGATVAIWWHIFPDWGWGTLLNWWYNTLRVSIDHGAIWVPVVMGGYWMGVAGRLWRVVH